MLGKYSDQRILNLDPLYTPATEYSVIVLIYNFCGYVVPCADGA